MFSLVYSFNNRISQELSIKYSMSLCWIQVSHNNLYFKFDLHSTHYCQFLLQLPTHLLMTTSPALAVRRYPQPETAGSSLGIGNRRILHFLLRFLWLTFGNLQLYDYFLFRYGTFFRIFYTFLLLLEFLMKTLNEPSLHCFFCYIFLGRKKG